jgi:glycosyltransferase involved in cell wall biosynthesis
MRVLVPLHGFISWNGGVDLMRLVVTCLRHADPELALDLVFAVPAAGPDLTATQRTLREMAAEFTAGSRVLELAYDARRINHAALDVGARAIFPTMLPMPAGQVKKVGYLYDFQHRDLPQFFTDEERARRDAQFAEVSASTDAIFVTSRSVARRVHELLGVAEERILALPFTPYVDERALALDAAAARRRYAIGARYAMVCNHFWMHKDHATALRALAQVVAEPRHAALELVLTGEMSDHRDPQHFARLRELIATLGIADRCRIVGLIPKADQIALLREAALLVQPTRYEGGPGGGSLFEACGLGVPAVVSDIEVNLEAAGEGVSFFAAGDADDLAQKMRAVLDAPREPRSADELLQRSRERLRHAGNTVATFLRRLVEAG